MGTGYFSHPELTLATTLSPKKEARKVACPLSLLIDLLEGAPLSWEDVWEPPGDTAQDDLPLPAMRVSVPAPVGTLSGVQVLEQYAGGADPRGREGASPRRWRAVRTTYSGRD